MYYNIRDRKFLSKLKRYLWKFLDFLFPAAKTVKEIEMMGAEEFFKRAKPSNQPAQSGAKALFAYNDPLVKNAIWLLKYRRNFHSAKLLGEILGSVTFEWLNDLKTFEDFSRPIIIPIPMGKVRLRERGGNHCELLCEEMLKTMPAGTAEYKPGGLYKIRETPSQTHAKNRAERLKNLSGSFDADSKLISGRNILLIDDVITTGATMEEGRRALLCAGAKRILAIAIAH